MRWKAAVLVGLLLVSGCLGGGSGTSDADDNGPQTIDTTASGNQTPANASENATYLKNQDYNETHVHDYWPGNATEKVLMDETVEAGFWFDSDASVGGTWFSLPNGSFVPEGTGELVVEVDATSALERGQQALSYTPANTNRYTQMDGQGAQATWEIEVSPEMADMPHAKSTRWAFTLEADGAGSVLDGEAHVRITAVKLHDLEAWPEHPDFWDKGQTTKLDLETINGTFERLETFASGLTDRGTPENAINFSDGTIVPPETKVLLLKFWFARDSSPTNNANGDVNLRVKEGSSSYWYSYQEHRIVREKPGYKMYAIPVDGASWDSPYAEKSRWSMLIDAPTGFRVPQEDATLEMGFAQVGSGNYTIDADVYRVIPPWLSSMMQEEGIADDASASDR